MDQELIAYLDKRFDEVNKQVRANGVEIEGLRGDIKQVAEGVAACNQRIDAFEVKVSEKLDEMRQLFDTSHSNLHRRVSSVEAWREKVDPSPPVARKRRT